MSKHISLSGLKTLLEPLIHLIDKKAERPDWNENDPSSSSYIENRICYDNTVIGDKVLSFKNLPAQATGQGYSYYDNFDGIPINIHLNKIYSITVNGITYNDIIFIDQRNSYIASSDYFYFDFVSNDYFYIEVACETSYITISISEQTGGIVKIDEKYLPDIVGAKGIGEGAEIFNDYEVNYASGNYAHAEGSRNVASGEAAHAEGVDTTASGHRSHAEGFHTVAFGEQAHAEGWGTIAQDHNQHVQGIFNIADTTSAHIVGRGTSDSNRSNAHTLDWDGNAWYSGDVYVGSTSGINKDEGSKKLATEEFVSNAVATIPTPDVTGQITEAIANLDASDVGAAPSEHTQAASTITAGTFAGAVVAQTSSQAPDTSLLRNSKLVPEETDPVNNGEIYWIYE